MLMTKKRKSLPRWCKYCKYYNATDDFSGNCYKFTGAFLYFLFGMFDQRRNFDDTCKHFEYAKKYRNQQKSR